MKKVLLLLMLCMALITLAFFNGNKAEEEMRLVTIGSTIQSLQTENLLVKLKEFTNSSELYIIDHFLEGLALKVRRDGSIFTVDWEIFIKDKDQHNYIRLDSEYKTEQIRIGSLPQTIVFENQPIFPLEKVLTALENAPWERILEELPGKEDQRFQIWLHTSYVNGDEVHPHPFSNDAPYLIVENDGKLTFESDYSKIDISSDKLAFFIHGDTSMNLLIDY